MVVAAHLRTQETQHFLCMLNVARLLFISCKGPRLVCLLANNEAQHLCVTVAPLKHKLSTFACDTSAAAAQGQRQAVRAWLTVQTGIKLA